MEMWWWFCGGGVAVDLFILWLRSINVVNCWAHWPEGMRGLRGRSPIHKLIDAFTRRIHEKLSCANVYARCILSKLLCANAQSRTNTENGHLNISQVDAFATTTTMNPATRRTFLSILQLYARLRFGWWRTACYLMNGQSRCKCTLTHRLSIVCSPRGTQSDLRALCIHIFLYICSQTITTISLIPSPFATTNI